jgi:hypothetical protein
MRDKLLSDLPETAKRLVREMQQLNFGTIEELRVRNGLPVFDPEPRVYREVKFGGQNGLRREAALDDFKLKPEVPDLLDQLADLGDGVVHVLEVKFGVPFFARMEKARMASQRGG